MAKEKLSLDELNEVSGGISTTSQYFSGLITREQIKVATNSYVWIVTSAGNGEFHSYKGGTITGVTESGVWPFKKLHISVAIDNNNGRPHQGNDTYEFSDVEWYMTKLQ